jgi:membrane associated rhomboid family serine protease
MIAQRSPDNDGPLTWLGSFPVYVSTAVAGLHGVALILSALAMAAGSEALLQSLMFSSDSVVRDASLWQLCTYAFVHTPPYWVFLFELYLLVVFGREIESYLGRAAFIKLYLLLLLAPSVFLTACDFAGWRTIYDGSSALHFGVFVAFALIYPTAEILFSIQAKWIALALLAINSLQCLALSNYNALAVLAVDCVSACLFIGFQQGRFTFRLPERSQKVRSTPRAAVARNPEPSSGDALDAIDPILEKISRHGIGSLTSRERERLEKARAHLIAKDGGL